MMRAGFFWGTVFVMLLIVLFGSAQAQNWNCYSKCMAGGGKYPAQCNNRCKAQNQRLLQKHPELRQQYESQKRNEIEDDEMISVDETCYKECLSRSYTDAYCAGYCNRDRETELDIGEETASKGALEKLDTSRGDDTFANVHMGCFKECRLEGESYKTCLTICRQ